MNSTEQILVIDVNAIIHIEKAGLLEKLVEDKNIRIVDLVYYDEYEFKPNLSSNIVSKIKKISLTESQVKEAKTLYENDKRNSFYDYCSYVIARDNGYTVLTGDWKLRRKIIDHVAVHGSIWYVRKLYDDKMISKDETINAYSIWREDSNVYMPTKVLSAFIDDLSNT